MIFVYMVQNNYGDLYVGISENPEKRVATHNVRQGAKFTKRDSSFAIKFLEKHNSLKEARAREIQIKKWRRDKKEMLIERYQKGFGTK